MLTFAEEDLVTPSEVAHHQGKEGWLFGAELVVGSAVVGSWTEGVSCLLFGEPWQVHVWHCGLDPPLAGREQLMKEDAVRCGECLLLLA